MFYNKKSKVSNFNNSNKNNSCVDVGNSNKSLLFFNPLGWASLCSNDNQNCTIW